MTGLMPIFNKCQKLASDLLVTNFPNIGWWLVDYQLFCQPHKRLPFFGKSWYCNKPKVHMHWVHNSICHSMLKPEACLVLHRYHNHMKSLGKLETWIKYHAMMHHTTWEAIWIGWKTETTLQHSSTEFSIHGTVLYTLIKSPGIICRLSPVHQSNLDTSHNLPNKTIP